MIDEERWKIAKDAEELNWKEVLKSQEGIKSVDAWERHFPVMGLTLQSKFAHKYIVDIGGGAISLLIRFPKVRGLVVDPASFEEKWIKRYSDIGIKYLQQKAEDFLSAEYPFMYDEVWIYNTLQHVQDPEFILRNIHKVAKVLRISEPCLTPIDIPHPHSFTPEWLYEILDEISSSGTHIRNDFDYPYVGGVFNLK